MKNSQKVIDSEHGGDFFTLKVRRFGLSWTALTSTGCALPIASGHVTDPAAIWALVALGGAGVLRDVALVTLAWAAARRATVN